MKSSYEKVKKFVKSDLDDEYIAQNGVLERDFIKSQVCMWKDNAVKLGIDPPLTDDDCERMIKDFEFLFNVKIPVGVVIQGDAQRKRDTTWWRDKAKLDLQKEGKDYLLRTI